MDAHLYAQSVIDHITSNQMTHYNRNFKFIKHMALVK